MKKLLLSIVSIILIAIIGLGIWVFVENKSINELDIPETTVKINNENLICKSKSAKILYFFNLLEKEVDVNNNTSNATVEILTETPIITSPKDIDAYIEITNSSNEKIFEGTKYIYEDEFLFETDDIYQIDIRLLGKTPKGLFQYDYSINVDVKVEKPIEYILTKDLLVQGELASILINNVKGDVKPTAHSELGLIRFTKQQSENSKYSNYKAIVPSSYYTNAGKYKIEVTLDNEIKVLNLEVVEDEFEIQRFNMDMNTVNATSTQSSFDEFNSIIKPTYEKYDENIYWQGNFIQPVINRISSPYGVIRYVNGSLTSVRHGGIDIAAPTGTPVACPNNAKIEVAQFLQRTGNTIVLEHGGGLKSYFYHLDSLNVKQGDMVTKGDIIGTVGTTGYSTGPHLHYEVQIGEHSINPWHLFDGTSAIFDK